MTVEHTRTRKIKIKTAFTHQTNLNAIDAWINIPVNSYLLLILLFDCYINLHLGIYMHVIVVLNYTLANLLFGYHAFYTIMS